MERPDKSLALLVLLGAALISGVSIDFAPEMIWHDQQRIEQLIFLTLASVGIVTIWRKKFLSSMALLSPLIGGALGLFVLAGVVSTVFAAFPRFAALELVVFFLLMVSALLLAVDSKKMNVCFDVWAMRLILTLAVFIAIKSLMGYVAFLFEGVRLDTQALFESTFSNRRVFGQVASLFIPVLAFPLLDKAWSRRARLGVFVLLVTWWMLVIVSGTRGSWAALAGSAVLVAIFAWRPSVGWLKVQVLALLGGVVLFVFLFVGIPALLGTAPLIENRFTDLATLSGREVLWGLAQQQIQLNPWLGVGPMHFAMLRNDFGAHPHNAVLQLVVEWGVGAFALLLAVVYGLSRMLLKLRHQTLRNSLLHVCLTVSLFAAAIQSLLDGVIVIPYTQLCLVFVAGWAIGLANRGNVGMPIVAESSVSRIGVPLVFILALAVLLYGVFPEIFNRVEVTEAYLNAGNTLLVPRFWGVGWIP